MSEKEDTARVSVQYAMPLCMAVDPEIADAYLYATGQADALRELAKTLADYISVFSAHKPIRWGQTQPELSGALGISLTPQWGRGCLKLQLADGYSVTLAAGSTEEQAYGRLRHLIAYRVQQAAAVSAP
jgi:hypothetical protein